MKYTEEQMACIQSDAPSLSINAFAGTGKTSTLVGRAKARKKEKILYLAFNRSMAEDASKRFPENVVCKSSHSLAFAHTGRNYGHKLGNNKATVFQDVLSEELDLGRNGVSDPLFFSKTIQDIVGDYLNSGVESLDIPERKWKVMDEGGQLLDPVFLAKAANTAWAIMRDKTDKRLNMPHDGYLKLFQLAAPKLPYDTVFLDEAQDTNPCLLKLVVSQKHANLVLVGDKHQSIYGFRGAMNAMDELAKKDATAQQLALTMSFRFGNHIANIANSILQTFMAETREIRGLARHESGSIGSRCILHRTNAGVFRSAVNACAQEKASFSFVGGIEGYHFDLILQSYFLSIAQNHLVKDSFLRRFKRFDELESYAGITNDKEVLARLKIISEFGQQIPSLVANIQAKHTLNGFVQLGTAHKAKGLEWDFVRISNDFPPTMIDEYPAIMPNCSEEDALALEEANLLYVACTRAKKGIRLTDDLKELVLFSNSAEE